MKAFRTLYLIIYALLMLSALSADNLQAFSLTGLLGLALYFLLFPKKKKKRNLSKKQVKRNQKRSSSSTPFFWSDTGTDSYSACDSGDSGGDCSGGGD